MASEMPKIRARRFPHSFSAEVEIMTARHIALVAFEGRASWRRLHHGPYKRVARQVQLGPLRIIHRKRFPATPSDEPREER